MNESASCNEETESSSILQNRKVTTNNLDWAHDFIVPWENMPKDLMKLLEENKRPSPSLRRQMIRIVTDSIQKITEKPGKKALAIIARKMINDYSAALADTLCGEVVGEGYSSLLKQMEVRFDNLNRTNPLNILRRAVKHQEEKSPSGDKKRKLGVADCYGCVNWQPPSLPVHETEATQKLKKSTMLEIALTNTKSIDMALVKKLLQETYYTLRKQINNGDSIVNIKKEWPLLFSREGIYDHFESLVGFDIFQKLTNSVASKGFRIISYLKSISNTKKHKENFQQWIAKLDLHGNDPDLSILLCLLMVYFDENIQDLFITVDVSII